ncbi:hypothetical protein HK096_007560 [Nowakowskiella sp. JEL0078]|nr:hypothetical protein HK096_007560 [Nowakowskiella sp. JEL0078]
MVGLCFLLIKITLERYSDGLRPVCQRCKRLKKDCLFARSREPEKLVIIEASMVDKLEARIKELEQALFKTKISSESDISIDSEINTPLSSTLNSNFMYSRESTFLFLQSITKPQSTLFSPLDPPFSPEIILDMLQAYIEYWNAWPLNFIHPRWLIAKRHSINPSIIYTLCALSCRNSKYEPLLRSMGYDCTKILFENAKRNFNHEDTTFENLMAVIFMGVFSVAQERFRQFLLYLSLALQYGNFLQINLDPDDLEQQCGLKFSNIEKESRRRVWFVLKSLFLKFSVTATVLEDTVKNPISLKLFHELTEDPSDLQFSSIPIDINCYDAEPLASSIYFIGFDVQKFHEKYLIREITLETYIEANCLYQKLLDWFYRSPEWIQNVFKPNSNASNFSGPCLILAQRLIFFYHSLILMVHRFAYSSLCRFPPPDIVPATIEPPQAGDLSLKICWNSHNSIVEYLKRNPILSESSYIRVLAISTLETLSQFAAFSCTMLRFSDTQEKRNIATKDFKFLRSCIVANAASGPHRHMSLASIFLDGLNQIHKLPFGLEREKETYRRFGIAINNFDKKLISMEKNNQSGLTTKIENSNLAISNQMQKELVPGVNPIPLSFDDVNLETTAVSIDNSNFLLDPFFTNE